MKRTVKIVALALILAAGFLGVSAQSNSMSLASACGTSSGSTTKPSLPR